MAEQYDKCAFHLQENPVSGRNASLSTPRAIPERKEGGECFDWRDYGDCTHGDRCRSSHGPDDTRGTAGEVFCCLFVWGLLCVVCVGRLGQYYLSQTHTLQICRNLLRGRCNNGDREHEGTPEVRVFAHRTHLTPTPPLLTLSKPTGGQEPRSSSPRQGCLLRLPRQRSLRAR